MSKYLRPDSSSKNSRYRASLARARRAVSISDKRKRGSYVSITYSNIRERGRRRPFMNHDTKRPYALNVQFKIRFFGTLHHATGHSPEKPAKRWRQAEHRWEAIFPRHRRFSMKVYDRRRSYM
jgi:hypothetical protein